MQNYIKKINLHNKAIFLLIFIISVMVLSYIRNNSYYNAKRITDTIEITQLAKNIHLSLETCLNNNHNNEICITKLDRYLKSIKPYGIIKISKNNHTIISYNRTKSRHLDRKLVFIPKYLTNFKNYNIYIAKHSTPNIMYSMIRSVTFSANDIFKHLETTNLKNTISWYMENRIYMRSQGSLIFMILVFLVLSVIKFFQKNEKLANYTNPKKLTRLLKNFTIDTPIKCTTHSWEGSCESCKEMDFDEFISKVQEQWDAIKDELKKLSPNLYVKIEAFLFSKTQQKWCNKTGLDLGWSNLRGLKEHCNNGGKPFEFVLKEPICLKDETLTTFKEIVGKFKGKIEVRNDGDMLKSIFVNFRKKLKKDAIKLKICPSLEGVDFYTDVEKLKSALDLIFSGIVAKKSYSDTVEIKLKKPDPESVEIYIIHQNSFSMRTKKELLKEVDDGDFKEIKENLTNLCDWSVEDKFEEKSYRVNYLKSSSVNEKEELGRDIEGFTHILRFYK